MSDWQRAMELIDRYVISPAQPRAGGSYSVDRVREQLQEIEQFFPARVLRFSQRPEWNAWGVRFNYRGYDTMVRYHPHHPYEPPLIYVDPAPKSHYYRHPGEADARLCWSQPGEWQPSFRLIVAVGSAMRFLNHHSRKA